MRGWWTLRRSRPLTPPSARPSCRDRRGGVSDRPASRRRREIPAPDGRGDRPGPDRYGPERHHPGRRLAAFREYGESPGRSEPAGRYVAEIPDRRCPGNTLNLTLSLPQDQIQQLARPGTNQQPQARPGARCKPPSRSQLRRNRFPRRNVLDGKGLYQWGLASLQSAARAGHSRGPNGHAGWDADWRVVVLRDQPHHHQRMVGRLATPVSLVTCEHLADPVPDSPQR